MRLACVLLFTALLVLPTAALADSANSTARLVEINPAAFPMSALPITRAMDAPQIIHCKALQEDGRYHAVGAIIADGTEVSVVFLTPEGSIVLRAEASPVAPALLSEDTWTRVSNAVGAVTEVLGERVRRISEPLPSASAPRPTSLTDHLHHLMIDGMALGWRFRECLVDLPYDLAREVIKSQVPPEYAGLVDAVVDGIRLFQSGSRAEKMLSAKPELRQPVYQRIISGLQAGHEVRAIQETVLGMLGAR